MPPGEKPTTYWKYGPTPGEAAHWYEFLYDGTTGAEFNGNIITLHFVDGQRGDDDTAADGSISDDGAPGESSSSGWSYSSGDSCFIGVLHD